MYDAATLSVWLLGGLTVAVQGAFVAFFLYLRRQTKLTAANELDLEWSRLQQGLHSHLPRSRPHVRG